MTINENIALGRVEKTRDTPEQCGLSTTRRAEQSQKLSFRDGEIDGLENADGVKPPRDVSDLQMRGVLYVNHRVHALLLP